MSSAECRGRDDIDFDTTSISNLNISMGRPTATGMVDGNDQPLAAGDIIPRVDRHGLYDSHRNQQMAIQRSSRVETVSGT